MNRQLRVPRLVDLHRIEPEAYEQIRRRQRFAHQTVGGHAADDADEVRGSLVDNPFHLGRDGYRQVPLSDPSPDALSIRRMDRQARSAPAAASAFASSAVQLGRSAPRDPGRASRVARLVRDAWR